MIIPCRARGNAIQNVTILITLGSLPEAQSRGHWSSMNINSKFEQRLGTLHARQGLGIEPDHEAQIFGPGHKSFPPGKLVLGSLADPKRTQINRTLSAGS